MNTRSPAVWLAGTLFMISLLMGYHPVSAQSPDETLIPQQPVVRAVLFHSPVCTFCRQIVEQDLPPVIQKFGQQLQILHVDVDTVDGEALYQAALEAFGLSRGVPHLFIDQTSMGGVNIPKQLPALVDSYLAQGGIDWPAIPGLDEYLAASQESESQTNVTSPSTSTPGPLPGSPTPPLANPASVTRVRAVMLWMDGCAHCHEVIENVLPPLQEKYGQQLEILMIEVATREDVDFLYEVGASYGIPRDRVGVPFLIIGKQVLIGSAQIPAELPGLISSYLAQGGVDWPDNPLLSGFLPPPDPAEESPTAALPTIEATPVPLNFLPTPPESMRNNGFTLAIVVLVLMVISMLLSLGYLIYGVSKDIHPAPLPTWLDWLIPALCVIGLGVAGYLSYVEITFVPAMCGPVGDCNSVQQSSYARLWGVLPIGVLGMAGYVAILAAWWTGRQKWGWLSAYAPMVLFGMAFFGTVFSAYLTYLEPFVIKAVCIWCISSAIIMTLLMLLSVRPALRSLIGDLHAEETPS